MIKESLMAPAPRWWYWDAPPVHLPVPLPVREIYMDYGYAQCSPSATCGVQSFLTQPSLYHLWDAAIFHDAVSTFSQLLVPLFVIFSSSSCHVLWFPLSCLVSFISSQGQFGYLPAGLTGGSKARRQSRKTTPDHHQLPQLLHECRNTAAQGGAGSILSKGKARLGLTLPAPWAHGNECLSLARSILYHSNMKKNIKPDQESEPRPPWLQPCPAAANSLLPFPSKTSVWQQWVAMSLRLLQGGEGRVEPWSFDLLQSSKTTLTPSFSIAYLWGSLIPVLLVIHVLALKLECTRCLKVSA